MSPFCCRYCCCEIFPSLLLLSTHKRVIFHSKILFPIILLSLGFSLFVENLTISYFEMTKFEMTFKIVKWKMYRIIQIQSTLESRFAGLTVSCSNRVLRKMRLDQDIAISARSYSTVYLKINFEIQEFYIYNMQGSAFDDNRRTFIESEILCHLSIRFLHQTF